MKKYSVTYKREHDGKTTLARNRVRNIACKCFNDETTAREFAKTVEVVSIYNDNTGKKISF